MSRSLVIVNPNASRVRDPQTRSALLERLRAALRRRDGSEPDVVITDQQGDTGPLVAAALAAPVAAVVGVGGDGTLRDIAAVLRGRGVPLGVVPAGTGNQLAAVLGIPRSAAAAADALAAAQPRSIDLGEVTLHKEGEPPQAGIFTIGCGMGFDARLMATTPDTWKRHAGSLAYLVQALRLALRIRTVPYQLEVDGRTIRTEASVAMVGNMGQLLPGSLDLRLPIEPDDGLLDLIVVGARGPLHGARGLADQLLRTSLGGGDGASSLRLRGRAITIAADRPEPLEVDGDHVGSGSLEAQVLPGAIEVLVPAAGPWRDGSGHGQRGR